MFCEKFNRKQHMKMMHSEKTNSTKLGVALSLTEFRWVQFKKVFKHNETFKRHLNQHEANHVAFDICNAKFMRKDNLHQQMWNVNFDAVEIFFKNKFVCKMCKLFW